MREQDIRHTGIRTMINEMKKAELPKPIFKNEREDFSVTFYNGEYPELYPEELQNTQVDTQVENMEKLILEFCKEAKSAREIVAKIGYKSIKAVKNSYLKPLIEKGLIKMTIPDKPRSSNQKYITISNK